MSANTMTVALIKIDWRCRLLIFCAQLSQGSFFSPERFDMERGGSLHPHRRSAKSDADAQNQTLVASSRNLKTTHLNKFDWVTNEYHQLYLYWYSNNKT